MNIDTMLDNEVTRSFKTGPVTPKEPTPMVKEALRRADILRNMQGCSRCKARIENPHADYHLTAVIDSSKI